MTRICKITQGSVELGTGEGDGAYDLLDVAGTPEEIGKAISDSLRETQLFSGVGADSPVPGRPIYLNLRIQIKIPATPEELGIADEFEHQSWFLTSDGYLLLLVDGEWTDGDLTFDASDIGGMPVGVPFEVAGRVLNNADKEGYSSRCEAVLCAISETL